MRTTITIIALLLGLAVVGGMFYHASRQETPPAPTAEQVDADAATPEADASDEPAADEPEAPAPADTDAAKTDDAEPAPQPDDTPDTAATPERAAPPVPAEPPTAAATIEAPAFDGLRMAEPTRTEPVIIGSDEEDSGYKMKVVFTAWGAGVKRITLADYDMGVDGAWADEPYVVIDHTSDRIAPFAARQVVINGTPVNLASQAKWDADEPVEDADGVSVAFTARIVDRKDEAVGRVVRTYRLAKQKQVDGKAVGEQHGYDLQLDQSFINDSGKPLTVRFLQNAQGDMIQDPAAYLGDRREYVTGYFNPADNVKLIIYTEGSHLNRDKVASKGVWPNPKASLMLRSRNRT